MAHHAMIYRHNPAKAFALERQMLAEGWQDLKIGEVLGAGAGAGAGRCGGAAGCGSVT